MTESTNDELVMLAMCLKCTGMKLIDEEDGEDIFDVSLHLWDQQDNGHFKIPMLKRNTDMFKVGNFYSMTFEEVTPEELSTDD